VPRRRQDEIVPNWSRLCRLAAPQAGYFTTAQASHVGFSPQLLQYYIQKALVLRTARGIFHLAQHPRADHEDIISLWLWSRREGVISHQTALVLHGLCEASEIAELGALSLTIPVSWRRRRLLFPEQTQIYYNDLAPTDTAPHGPLLMTTPLRTLVDCVQACYAESLIEAAIRQAVKRKLVTRISLRRALRRCPPALSARTRGTLGRFKAD
jgi:predicted transcriptional regulator of viral defense system